MKLYLVIGAHCTQFNAIVEGSDTDSLYLSILFIIKTKSISLLMIGKVKHFYSPFNIYVYDF